MKLARSHAVIWARMDLLKLAVKLHLVILLEAA